MKKNLKKEKTKNKKRNILITGTNGYLGSVILDKILKRNYNIFALDKEKPIRKKVNVNYLTADISNKKELEKYKKIFKKINILVHLAAYVPLEKKLDNLEKSININLKGTINLVNLLRNKSIFIFSSTCEIYRVFNNNMINENIQNRNVSFYAVSKLFSEKYLEIICKEKDITFIFLRFASIYGPGEKIQRAIPNFIKSAIKNEDIIILGDGKEKRTYLYVEDAAQSVIRAIHYKKSGIFNIASEEIVTILGLAKLIKEFSKSKSKIIFRPRKKEKVDLVFSSKKARSEIKFSPKFSLAKGLKKEIEYFKKYG